MDDYEIIEEDIAKKYGKSTTTRKAIGDFMMSESHAVDVKSNNIEKQNYSPNIISIKKMHEWVFEKNNRLSFVFVDYKKSDDDIDILDETELIPIENISWECLTVEAQGYGVIQKNKDLIVEESQSKKEFYEDFLDAYQTFRTKERKKHEEFSERFLNPNQIV